MKKYKKIISFIFLFMLILFISLFCTIFGNDEIWNYGFAYNIYKGLIPYKDFNMIITPFFPFLMSLPFHIFGNSEMVLQITNSLFLTFIFILLDDLFGDKKYMILLFLIFPLPLMFPSYNIFLFVLLVVLFYLEKEKSNDIIIGLVLGLFFLTKQTVGGCIFIVGILFFIKHPKKVFKRLIGFLIPVGILFVYLIFNRALIDFIDLCFLGLMDFGNENFSISLINIFLFLCLVINALYYIKRTPNMVYNYYILAFYSIMIPLFDIYHIQISILACIILNFINVDFLDKYVKYIKFFSLFVTTAIALTIFHFSKPHVYPNNINHFEYRLIPKPNIEFTEQVNKYIKDNKDKKIVFLVADAYYFKIINDEKISKLDLINNGNWGYNGSKKIVNEVKQNKDALFVIYEGDFDEKSQIDKKVLKYIKKNFCKLDTIGIYDIYVYPDK